MVCNVSDELSMNEAMGRGLEPPTLRKPWIGAVSRKETTFSAAVKGNSQGGLGVSVSVLKGIGSMQNSNHCIKAGAELKSHLYLRI